MKNVTPALDSSLKNSGVPKMRDMIVISVNAISKKGKAIACKDGMVEESLFFVTVKHS